jgi:hypothetical protein
VKLEQDDERRIYEESKHFNIAVEWYIGNCHRWLARFTLPVRRETACLHY